MTHEIGSQLAEVIINLRTLSTLNIEGNNLGDTGVHFIAQGLGNHNCRALRELNLNKTGITRKGFTSLFQKGVSFNRSLVKLTVDRNSMGTSNFFRPIKETLERTKTLKFFSARECGLSDDFGVAFGGGLIKNKTLEHVDLS